MTFVIQGITECPPRSRVSGPAAAQPNGLPVDIPLRLSTQGCELSEGILFQMIWFCLSALSNNIPV